MDLAVVLTCFNRKELTLRCVSTLTESAESVPELKILFYIWDDASSDGTAEALGREFDNVRVFKGPGNYYWSRGMYSAMSEAVKGDHELYLMVNDDVIFYPDSIRIMIDSYKRSGGCCGIVGTTRNGDDVTYGGKDEKFSDIPPTGNLIRCRYSNWNCFLTDRDVINRIGVINPKYRHAFGDYDYSGRMNRRGIPQYVATDYIGECELNDRTEDYLDPSRSVINRIKALSSPKGLPIGGFYRFHWVDKGFRGIVIATYSYFRLIIRIFTVRLRL